MTRVRWWAALDQLTGHRLFCRRYDLTCTRALLYTSNPTCRSIHHRPGDRS